MRFGTFVPLIIGLGAGVVAVWVGLGAIQNAKKGAQPSPEITVMVAKVEIPYAVKIRSAMLEAKKFGTFPLDGRVGKAEDLIDRVTATKIVKNTPILWNMLSEKGTLPGAENQIQRGYRPEPVLVKPHNVIDLDPGNHVDVLYYPKARGSYQSERKMKRILQNVQVFSVGDRRIGMETDTNADDTGTKSSRRSGVSGRSGGDVAVKLLVRNEDVKTLREAHMNGTIELSMRAAGDDTLLPEDKISVMGDESPPSKEKVLTRELPPKLEPIIHRVSVFDGSGQLREVDFLIGTRLISSGEDAEAGSAGAPSSQSTEPLKKEPEPD